MPSLDGGSLFIGVVVVVSGLFVDAGGSTGSGISMASASAATSFFGPSLLHYIVLA